MMALFKAELTFGAILFIIVLKTTKYLPTEGRR
jgi:hypothetical protein